MPVAGWVLEIWQIYDAGLCFGIPKPENTDVHHKTFGIPKKLRNIRIFDAYPGNVKNMRKFWYKKYWDTDHKILARIKQNADTSRKKKKNIARKVIQNTNACKKRRNMAALPTGKHFDLTESQKELLKKLQEALVCCDPLTQDTCSWSKFASNVRWPTLSFSCQKQEKCLSFFHSRRAKSTHCDHFWKVCKTAEGGRDAAVLTLYKSRGETESWKRCVWREHMSNGLSWAMHEGSVPTAALIL